MLSRTAKATISCLVLVLLEAIGQDSVSDGSCTTVLAKTQTTGSVLMQSASIRARLMTDFHRNGSAQSEHADVNRTFLLDAAIEMATGVAMNVSAASNAARSALEERFNRFSWPSLFTIDDQGNHVLVRGDTSVLITVCILLVVVAALFLWLLKSIMESPSSLRPATSELLAQQRFDPPVYSRSTTPPSPRQKSHYSPSLQTKVPQSYASRPFDQDNRGVSYTPPAPVRFASPRNQARGISQETPFCPELIVPQQSECILLMPIDTDRRNSNFEVTDVNGSTVLRVVPEPATLTRSWRATIQTATGEMLGQCCEARYSASSGAAAREFLLLRAGGETYGKLRHSPAQDRYVLTLVNGTALHFWGNFENYSVNFTDDKDRLFATTETGVIADFDPRGAYCRLRIAPLVDVGLTLCGLLCIGQHMVDQRRLTSV